VRHAAYGLLAPDGHQANSEDAELRLSPTPLPDPAELLRLMPAQPYRLRCSTCLTKCRVTSCSFTTVRRRSCERWLHRGPRRRWLHESAGNFYAPEKSRG